MPIKSLLRLASAAALLPAPVFALGIRIADQDAAATSRGNAFAATADNPSAIYYNPAGITQLEGQNFSAGVYSIYLNSHYTPATGRELDTIDKVQFVPELFYTLTPQNCPVSFGLGVYSPYGLSLAWPDTAPFRNVGQVGKLAYVTVNPVVAWKICPQVSIAAGPTFNYGDLDLSQGIFVPGDRFHFTGDDIAVGFNAGIHWQPCEQHSFGVSYRSATDLNFDGHADTKLLFPFSFNNSEDASANFRFPQNIVVGYSFRPTPNWNLEVNVDWTDWDNLNTVTLKKASGNTPLAFNWQSSFFYEFGATRKLGDGYAVSGGYIYSENSVPNATFNPVVPDSDRHIFSVGVGRKHDHLSWDAAYQFAFGPSRDVNNGTTANGSYQFMSHALILSIGYRF